MSKIYLAGSGAISSIGNNVAETFKSLKESKSGVAPISILQTQHAKNIPAAEVKFTNTELAKMAGLNESISRTALLSMIAAQEALTDSTLSVNLDWRSGFVSANTVGGMDLTEHFMKEYLNDTSTGNLQQVINHDCGAATEIVAKRLGIKNHVSTISTACSSSANAIMYAARLIKNDILDWAIAGGTDAMSAFTLNGFKALMILDDKPCTPYDENRKGLNLGEGAGYVVLVSEKVAATLPKKMTVELSGYANANDAFHQTASSPEGKGNFLAMEAALKMSGLKTNEIDYINLHGTGTPNNDVSEGIAIMRLFGEHIPKSSSTKAFTGHTLAACGGIEAIISLLSIENKMLFPNLRLETPMKELSFSPITELQEDVEIKNVLSNSFGFGGNCSSLIFSKV